MSFIYTVDTSGAVKKINTLKIIPNAYKKQLTAFGADTVKALRESARTLKSSYRPGIKSGALMRSVGMKIIPMGQVTALAVGTGIGTSEKSKMAEKYARIQDTGGVTHPKVTDKMRRWAWAMHYKEFGRETRGLGLRGSARKGAWATWGATNIYKAIALTKKDKLTVKIPATRWFSDVWEFRLSLLMSRYLNKDIVLKKAKEMTGVDYAE